MKVKIKKIERMREKKMIVWKQDKYQNIYDFRNDIIPVIFYSMKQSQGSTHTQRERTYIRGKYQHMDHWELFYKLLHKVRSQKTLHFPELSPGELM